MKNVENFDEGFGRNLNTLFGHSEFKGMGGKLVQSVTLSDDKTEITFLFKDKSKAIFRTEGDCCSHSWIEYLTVPDDIEGQELISVEDSCIAREDDGGFDVLQVYNTKFHTAKGDIIIEYRNSSNGYYGGYLIRVDENGKRIY